MKLHRGEPEHRDESMMLEAREVEMKLLSLALAVTLY